MWPKIRGIWTGSVSRVQLLLPAVLDFLPAPQDGERGRGRGRRGRRRRRQAIRRSQVPRPDCGHVLCGPLLALCCVASVDPLLVACGSKILDVCCCKLWSNVQSLVDVSPRDDTRIDIQSASCFYDTWVDYKDTLYCGNEMLLCWYISCVIMRNCFRPLIYVQRLKRGRGEGWSGGYW